MNQSTTRIIVREFKEGCYIGVQNGKHVYRLRLSCGHVVERHMKNKLPRNPTTARCHECEAEDAKSRGN